MTLNSTIDASYRTAKGDVNVGTTASCPGNTSRTPTSDAIYPASIAVACNEGSIRTDWDCRKNQLRAP